MKQKGQTGWYPWFLVDEIEDLKKEESINKNKDAMVHLVKYARVGRELNRIIKLDFTKSTKRPKL